MKLGRAKLSPYVLVVEKGKKSEINFLFQIPRQTKIVNFF